MLLVADPANMNYLTGYDGWSFYTPQMVIVHPDHEEPIWIGRGMDASGAQLTAFMVPENNIGYPDHLVQSSIHHPMHFIADYLCDRGWDKQVVGLEMDAYYFTGRCYRELVDRLPKTTFKDGELMVNWVRLVKSDQEIDYMRQAAQINTRAIQRAIEVIEPGVRGCDAAGAVYQAQISGTEGFGGDYPAFIPIISAGKYSAAPHLTWTDEPFGNEQTVMLELAGCRHHYHCPLCRTMYLGASPPAGMKNTADIVAEGIAAALAAVKPGAICEEIELAWRTTVAKYGMEKEARVGYAMGLNYPPDWGEHTASFRAGDRTVLQANMTFHMTPSIWSDDCGYECSESFRVTENGVEVFMDIPRQLIIKES